MHPPSGITEKEKQLNKIRYHWHSYIARGGLNEPKSIVGRLEKGGIAHWTLFLQLGRQYLRRYPKEKYIIEGFVPSKMMPLLTGE